MDAQAHTANERWLHLGSAKTDLQSAIQSAAHPARRGRSEHRGRRRARALWGLLWATKRDPSQNREGEGGQALGGRQANQKINNQIEDGVWDGGKTDERRGRGKTDGGAFFTSFGGGDWSENEGQLN